MEGQGMNSLTKSSGITQPVGIRNSLPIMAQRQKEDDHTHGQSTFANENLKEEAM